MEEFKAFVAASLSPLIASLALQFIGWLMIWKQKKCSGLVLLGLGTMVLVIGSLSGFTHEANRRLEFAFEPLDLTNMGVNPDRSALIVVLGTGFNDDPTMPANSQVSGTFLSRLLEGTRIFRNTPNSQLMISVAGDASEQSKKKFLSNMLELLAIDADRVTMIVNAESTVDEAEEVQQRYKEKQLVLVTSAAHMNRAMRIFSDVGLTPIAAPTGYHFARKGSSADAIWPRWIPSTQGIGSNHQWLYENVAMLWHSASGD